MIYFIGDTHFCHANILAFDLRPFSTIEEHDEFLIKNWNSIVSKNDEIYHLGDFSFRGRVEKVDNILSRLNGKKYLIKGNHDKIIVKSNLKRYFEWIKDYHELTCNNKRFILFHYPIYSWVGKNRGSYMIYGHCHGKVDMKNLSIDVGCNVHNYTPISIETICNIMKKKEEIYKQKNLQFFEKI